MWNHSISHIIIVLLQVTYQGNTKTKTKNIICQRSHGQFLVQVQQKQFIEVVKAVEPSEKLTNDYQDGNW